LKAFDCYEKLILEKINRNFLNDDFFKSLLEVNFPDNPGESDSGTLFEKFLEFANECYIHGITVGMKVAIEMYEEENK
jgi:hypothetical protein